jgi:hypothetical protein
VTYETSDVSRRYPNFGAYWNYRTAPVVRDLVEGGPARKALGDVSDQQLADILRAVDEMAARNFIEFAGWDSAHWEDSVVLEFMHTHRPK